MASRYAAKVLATPGLVGYWRLGETAGAYADSGPNALPLTYAAGIRGVAGALPDSDRALDMAEGVMGASRVDNAVLDLGAQLSIAQWVYLRPGSPASSRPLVDKSVVLATSTNYALYAMVSGALELWGNLAVGGAFTPLALSANAPRGRWIHAVTTYDASSGGRLYIDGVQSGTTFAYAGALATNAGDLRVGGANSISDEVAVFNRALTPAEVANLFEGRSGLLLPDFALEAALNQNPLDPAPVWTDLTAYMLGYRIRRGRQRSLRRFEPGRMTLRLWNSDGRFDPTSSAGPYGVGFGAEDLRIRIRATWAGVTYGRMTGFVSRVRLTWPNEFDGVAIVEADGALRVLAGLIPVVDEFGDSVRAEIGSVKAWYRFDEAEGAWVLRDHGPSGLHGNYRFASKQSSEPSVPSHVGSSMHNLRDQDQAATAATVAGAYLPAAAAPSGTGDWAIEVMVRASTKAGAILSRDLGDSTAWQLAFNSDPSAFPVGKGLAVFDAAGTEIGAVGSVGAGGVLQFNDSLWHHLTMMRFNASGNTAGGLLVEGVVGPSGAIWAHPPPNTVAQPIKVGYADPANLEVGNLYGDVDEIVVWNGLPTNAGRAFRAKLRFGQWQGHRADTRVSMVLTAIGWPVADRLIPYRYPVRHWLAPLISATESALDHLGGVETTEGGLLLETRDGKVAFDGHPPWAFSPTPIATLGDRPGEVNYAEPPDFVYSRDDVYTKATVSSQGLAEQSYETPGLSPTRVGRTLKVSDALFASGAAQAERAHELWEIAQRTPRLDLPAVRVDAWSDPDVNLPFMLGAELIDAVLHRRRRPGVAGVLETLAIVNNITEDYTPGRLSMVFGLEPFVALPRPSAGGYSAQRALTPSSVTAGTTAAISFDTDRWVQDYLHDPVKFPTRLNFYAAGDYVITAYVVALPETGDGRRTVSLRLNGVTLIVSDTTAGQSNYGPIGGAFIPAAWSVETLWRVAAGDYIEVVVESSGATGSGFTVLNPAFSVSRVG